MIFTKGGLIVGVGGGEGVLVLREATKYPFTVSGMSVGFTIGALDHQASSDERSI